jgi:hypothetical protein
MFLARVPSSGRFLGWVPSSGDFSAVPRLEMFLARVQHVGGSTIAKGRSVVRWRDKGKGKMVHSLGLVLARFLIVKVTDSVSHFAILYPA